MILTTSVDRSNEPESIISVGDWAWVQYVDDNEELDNRMALVVAILRYNNGNVGVAIIWGKETDENPKRGPQHVVCTDDCQVVEKASIGGRVVEAESGGRVETENSDGLKFSLDRYQISSLPDNRLVVRGMWRCFCRPLTLYRRSSQSLSKRTPVDLAGIYCRNWLFPMGPPNALTGEKSRTPCKHHRQSPEEPARSCHRKSRTLMTSLLTLCSKAQLETQM